MSQNKQYLCKQHEIGKNNDVFIIIKASISDKKNHVITKRGCPEMCKEMLK